MPQSTVPRKNLQCSLLVCIKVILLLDCYLFNYCQFNYYYCLILAWFTYFYLKFVELKILNITFCCLLQACLLHRALLVVFAMSMSMTSLSCMRFPKAILGVPTMVGKIHCMAVKKSQRCLFHFPGKN